MAIDGAGAGGNVRALTPPAGSAVPRGGPVGGVGYDRVPPHNLDAEVSVLGGMLLSRDAIAEVSEYLGPDDFYRGAHRTVFEACRDLYDRGEPVDPVTVADELQRHGRLDDVGGPLAVMEFVERTPTAANALYYAKIVADHALRRRLIDAGTRITKLGYDPANGVAEAVDAAESEVFAVAQQRRGASDFSNMKELLRETFQLIEKRSETRTSVTGLATGFVDFDEMTSGLQPGNLIILAARPGMGKSTLVTNIAAHVAVQLRRPAIMFSLEMTQMELVQRLLAGQARIDSRRLKTGDLGDQDWSKMSKAMGELGEAPLFLDETGGINLMEIRTKCRRLKQQHGLDLVIIDYLQLMQSHRRAENRVQEVSEMSRGLKVLAGELGVPVIALSQLNRAPENRGIADKRPQLADLRESGSIEQDADMVCFIYRDEVYDPDTAAKGEAELLIAKNRNGPLSTVRLSFIGHHSRFASMARGAPPGGPL